MSDKKQEFFYDIRKKIQNFQYDKKPGEISKTHEKKEYIIRYNENYQKSKDKESHFNKKNIAYDLQTKVSSILEDKNLNKFSILEAEANYFKIENGNENGSEKNENKKMKFKDLLDLHIFPYKKLQIKSNLKYENFMVSHSSKEIKNDILKGFLNLKS